MLNQVSCKTERKKQREKWKDATKAYMARKNMANLVIDFTPPSMENITPVLLMEESSENVDPMDPILNDDLSPPVVSTPVRDERKNTCYENKSTVVKKKNGNAIEKNKMFPLPSSV